MNTREKYVILEVHILSDRFTMPHQCSQLPIYCTEGLRRGECEGGSQWHLAEIKSLIFTEGCGAGSFTKRFIDSAPYITSTKYKDSIGQPKAFISVSNSYSGGQFVMFLKSTHFPVD